MHPTYTWEQKMHAYETLRAIKINLATRGWFPATSGNVSLRLSPIPSPASGTPCPLTFMISASGKDKTQQTAEDFLIIQEANPVEQCSLKPSAETMIHEAIYNATTAQAIFHVHTVTNALVSELDHAFGHVTICGVELIKALNIWEEGATIHIPIVPNYADVSRIAALLPTSLVPRVPAILLRNHGIYVWGDTATDCLRHLEAFEYLLEYRYREWTITRKTPPCHEPTQ